MLRDFDMLEGMGTTSAVPVEKYLESYGEPDWEYVDGELVERAVGERGHSRIQANLIAWFHTRRRALNIRALPELRLQLSPQRFRVPDVLIEDENTPTESIVRTPPLLCVEILSPEDQYGRVLGKVEEYLAFGVACVWVIDPEAGLAWVHTAIAGGGTQTRTVREGDLQCPTGRLSIPFAELFAD